MFQKTIKPWSTSAGTTGTAGGEKYVCQGIFFKLAKDVSIRYHWLYGGRERNDEKAMKATLHELKGLASLLQCRIDGLKFPLVAAIHYKGFCLHAASLLPTTDTSLVYGSNDGGMTCKSELPVSKWMAHAGMQLNLAPHLVKDCVIYGPGDFEVHKGTDGNYYCLDFARFLPPEAPSIKPSEIFYNLLRPQLISQWSAGALCSDALSGWMCGESEADRTEMESHIVAITSHLHSNVIPNTCKLLLASPRSGHSLIDFIHQNGINCRHLGRMRGFIEKNFSSKNGYKTMSQILLVECVSRTLKNMVRFIMRKNLETKSQKYLATTVCEYLQPFFYFRSVNQFHLYDQANYLYINPNSSAPLQHSEDLTTILTDATTRVFLLSETLSCFYSEITILEANEGTTLQFGLFPKSDVDSNHVLCEGKAGKLVSFHRYWCKTCSPTQQLFCCFSCLTNEHTNHAVVKIKSSKDCPCWCGAGGYPNACKLKSWIPNFSRVSTPFSYRKDASEFDEFSFAQNQAVGFFCDNGNRKFLMTKDSVSRTFIESQKDDLIPVIVASGPVRFKYEILSDKRNSTTKFPFLSLCREFHVDVPPFDPQLDDRSRTTWKEPDFKAEILERFQECLTPQEVDPKFDLRQKVDPIAFKDRFSVMTGISFLPSFKFQERLRVEDFIFESRSSDMCIIDEINSYISLATILRSKQSGALTKQIDLLEQAEQTLSKVISNAVVKHLDHYYYRALISFDRAIIVKSLRERFRRLNFVLQTLAECSVLEEADTVWQKKIDILKGLVYIEIDRDPISYFQQLWTTAPEELRCLLQSLCYGIMECFDQDDVSHIFSQISVLRSSAPADVFGFELMVALLNASLRFYECNPATDPIPSVLSQLENIRNHHSGAIDQYFDGMKGATQLGILIQATLEAQELICEVCRIVKEDPRRIQTTHLTPSLMSLFLKLWQSDENPNISFDNFRRFLGLNEAFQCAAQNGWLRVVNLLSEYVNSSSYLTGLENSAQNGHYEIFKALLEGSRAEILLKKSHFVRLAAEGGHYQIIEAILKHQDLDPFKGCSEALRLASKNGRLKVVKLLLPFSHDDSLIPTKVAIENGNFDTASFLIQASKLADFQSLTSSFLIAFEKCHFDQNAQTLLSAHKFDDSVYDCGLLFACQKDQLDLLKLCLLKGSDPSAKENQAIRIASELGNTKIVEFLLRTEGVDPADQENYAIRVAAKNGHHQVAQLLQSCKKVDPSSHQQAAVRSAAENGHLESFKLLFSPSQITSQTQPLFVEVFKETAKKGYLEIFKILSETIDPATQNDLPLRLAALSNQVEIVKFLLANEKVDPTTDRNGALRWAAQEGNLEVVKILLAHKAVDPAARNNEALQTAAKKGHLEVVKILLEREGVDPAVNDSFPLRIAAENGFASVVKFLMEYPTVDPGAKENHAFRLAAQHGHLETLKVLITSDRVDPYCNYNAPIRQASCSGHVEVVRFLLSLPNIDPSPDSNYAIRAAARDGYCQVVKLLLESGKVDPTAKDNFAFQTAAKNGHTEILKVLLSSPVVDPAVDNNYAIRFASLHGHVETVKLLLSCEEVDPSAQENRAFQLAAKEGHLEVIKLLMGSGKVNPATRANFAINTSSRQGQSDIVSYLLTLPKVDPTAGDNYPIRFSARNGHFETFRVLLASGRVDPFSQDNYALKWSAANGHEKIVRLLLSQPGVNPSAEQDYPLRYAAKNGHTETVKLLLSAPTVNPSSMDEYSLRFACQNGHLEIVKLLTSCKTVNLSINQNLPLRLAAKKCHFDVVKFLLKEPILLENLPTNLPLTLQVHIHQHQLSIQQTSEMCRSCFGFSTGPFYCCDECNFSVDACCAEEQRSPESFQHPIHRHILFKTWKRWRSCDGSFFHRGCLSGTTGTEERIPMWTCNQCNFDICQTCKEYTPAPPNYPTRKSVFYGYTTWDGIVDPVHQMVWKQGKITGKGGFGNPENEWEGEFSDSGGVEIHGKGGISFDCFLEGDIFSGRASFENSYVSCYFTCCEELIPLQRHVGVSLVGTQEGIKVLDSRNTTLEEYQWKEIKRLYVSAALQIVFEIGGVRPLCFYTPKAKEIEAHCKTLAEKTQESGFSYLFPKDCSFVSTSSNHEPQAWYRCETCWEYGKHGCCSVCAVLCHGDHKISKFPNFSPSYCDCGESRTCRCLPIGWAEGERQRKHRSC